MMVKLLVSMGCVVVTRHGGRCILREALEVPGPDGGERNSARVSEIEVLRP